MNRRALAVLLLIFVGALALRLPRLNQRPMHNDEAVNAVKFGGLWERGQYRYDPDEYHGPTLCYFTLPFAWLSPAKRFSELSETTLRLVPLAFGVGLILLLPLLADGLGRRATLCAAGLTALSPAMVFYSRYYIHEMLLVFFSLLAFGAAWRYRRSGRGGWAMLAGAAVGLMYATKETFVLHVAALILAAAATLTWQRWVERNGASVGLGLSWPHALGFAAAMPIVAIVFFSSFFSNLHGPLDAITTYLPWLKRAGGHSPHIHPWYFYLERLGWFQIARGPVFSEGLVLALAGVGITAAFTRRGLGDGSVRFVRVLAFYTLFLAGIYSFISYKTPWCFLGFLHGLILLAGVGAVALVQLCSRPWLRMAVLALLTAATVHLGVLAWRASYPYAARRENPYVYAHTSSDVLKLIDRVKALADVHPQGRDMTIKVMSADSYWPLPWYLRGFTHVGWWDHIPPDPFAPVMIVSSKLEAALDARPEKSHLMPGFFELRPGSLLELYVQLDLWKAYLPTVKREEE